MTKSQNTLEQAMSIAEEIHEKNAIKISGGKMYSKVVHRIEALRRTFGTDMGIETEISPIANGFCSKALIRDKDGRIIASGFSYSSNINAQKALEKMETVSVGRALANLGLGGDEYASLDEIDSHEGRYAQDNNTSKVIKVATDDEIDTLIAESQNIKTLSDYNEFRASKAVPLWKRSNEAQKAALDTNLRKIKQTLESEKTPEAAE